MSVPFDLNGTASPTEILRGAGIIVKGSIPEEHACPVCKKGHMGIWRDPLSQSKNAWWMKCDSCDLLGDSLETFARLQHKGMDDAIQDAMRFGCFCIPHSELNNRIIEGYKEHYVARRITVRQHWEELCKLLMTLKQETITRLVKEHLWSGRGPGLQGLRSYIGGGTRQDINNIFGIKNFLPRKGYATTLAIAYQDVPGRICSIRYYGEDTVHIQNFPEPVSHTCEGGLAFLDDIEPREQTVFAFDNPFMPLMLQRVWASGACRPTKMVAYNDNTGMAWNSVRAEKLIFKPERVVWRTFAQARLASNAYITLVPDMNLAKLEQKLNVDGGIGLFKKMEATAKPWKVFLVEWLTDDNRSDSEAIEVVSNLNIKYGERVELMEICPQDRKVRLEWCLGEKPASKSIFMGGREIIERDDGWYAPVAGNNFECLSDAIIRVENTFGDPKTGLSWLAGYIVYAGKRVPFKDSEETVTKDPFAWLKDKLVKANIGVPIVQERIKRSLINIARTFHKDKFISTLRKLGYDATTGNIIFPRFTIREGRFEVDGNYIESVGMPAQDIMPAPERLDMRHKLVSENDATLSSHLAGMAAVTANLLAPLNGWAPRPIGVVGALNNLPFRTGKRLAELFNAPIKEQHKLEPAERQTLQSDSALQGWIHHVSLTGGRLKGFTSAGSENLMLTVDKLEALALQACGERWTLVEACDEADVPPLPGTHDWLHWLADLQSRMYTLDRLSDLPITLLEDFCLWWANKHDRIKEQLFQAAASKLITNTAPGQALVELYVQLYKQGELNVERRDLMRELQATGVFTVAGKKVGIVIDETENSVYLVRSKLTEILRRLDVVLSDLSTAEKDMLRTGIIKVTPYQLDGWIINRQYFCQVEKRVIYGK